MKTFKDFTPIEILDMALNIAASNSFSKEGIIISDWIEELKKQYDLELSPEELEKVTAKLVKDGHLEMIEKTVMYPLPGGVVQRGHVEWRYFITWEGIALQLSGGYKSPSIEKENIKRLNEQQRKQGIILFRLNWIIALGTGIAAIYYSIEILKFFWKK